MSTSLPRIRELRINRTTGLPTYTVGTKRIMVAWEMLCGFVSSGRFANAKENKSYHERALLTQRFAFVELVKTTMHSGNLAPKRFH